MKNNQRGATSVLVIFMMLVLVTLGAFAITSAHANYRLSQRALLWKTMYYRLDALGEEYLSLIDSRLAKAEKIASDFTVNKRWQNMVNLDIPSELKVIINQRIANNPGNPEAEAFNTVFLHYSNLFLIELTDNLEHANISLIGDGLEINSLLISLDITDETFRDEGNGLQVTLWVEPAASVVETDNGLSLTWRYGNRYIIEDWYEYQQAQDDAPAMSVWDGTF